MFEKILVPTDFSGYAKKTLECISRFPQVHEVILFHVIDATHYSRHGWEREPQVENAKILLEEEKEILEKWGIQVQTRVRVITEGEIYGAILDLAEKEKVSLTVMGSRGRSLIQGLLLGSVSAGVLRHGKTHQMIIRHMVLEEISEKAFDRFCPGILRRVLFPTDFSPPAGAALEILKTLEGLGEVILVHVISRGETRAEIQSSLEDAKKKLGVIAKDLLDAGLMVRTHIRLGRPPDEINLLAEEDNASLIVISSHGKTMFQEMLVGSTTLGTAIHAKRPLLVIRYSH
jgi:nucleotide-binding universal stress UspA family protein